MRRVSIFMSKLYKLIAILRRQYHIILTASYSVLGGVAKRRSPIVSHVNNFLASNLKLNSPQVYSLCYHKMS